MVQLMSPAMAELEGKCRKRVVVKLETEDSPESQIGTLRKRPKLDSFSQVSICSVHFAAKNGVLFVFCFIFFIYFETLKNTVFGV